LNWVVTYSKHMVQMWNFIREGVFLGTFLMKKVNFLSPSFPNLNKVVFNGDKKKDEEKLEEMKTSTI
jgi:hypothetical protein